MCKCKRIFAAVLAAGMFVSGLIGTASAGAFGFKNGDRVIVNAGGPSRRLNYRAGWGTDHAVLRSYEDGTQATVLEVSPKGLWFRCRMPDGRQDGWFWGGYLVRANGAAVGATHVISNRGMFVNLRSVPNGAVLARIPDGAKVRMISSGGEWSLVEYGGLTGYVMSHFLRRI